MSSFIHEGIVMVYSDLTQFSLSLLIYHVRLEYSFSFLQIKVDFIKVFLYKIHFAKLTAFSEENNVLRYL